MSIRVHLGCAGAVLDGWINVDVDPRVDADVHADPFDLVLKSAQDIGEVYLGRLIERLCPDDAVALVRLIVDRAPEGTPVTAAAVDVRAASQMLVSGAIDIEGFNEQFVHASVPGAEQRWSYDAHALAAVLERGGLYNVATVDASSLPDARHVPAAVANVRCAVAGSVRRSDPNRHGHPDSVRVAEPLAARGAVATAVASTGPPTAQEELLSDVQELRAELLRLRKRERTALQLAGRADRLQRELSDTQQTLSAVTGSISFRVAQTGSRVARRLLPATSRRRAVAAGILRAMFTRRATGDDEVTDG